jgi:hypothetical protein
VRDELLDELGLICTSRTPAWVLALGMRNRARLGSCRRTWPMRRSHSSLARMPLRARSSLTVDFEMSSASAMLLGRGWRAARERVGRTRARPRIRVRGESDGRRSGVLPAGRVDERDELVIPRTMRGGLGPRTPHAPPTGRAALDVLVLDRLVEDCGDRSRTQRVSRAGAGGTPAGRQADAFSVGALLRVPTGAIEQDQFS